MAFKRLFKAFAAITLASSIQSVAATASTNSVCANAGKCIPFTIDLTWGPSDPSKAISRNAILTNGTLPGPPLKMKVGDCVDFTVINNMPNVTGIHFHGIRQNGTPYSDGVPGVSQYVIQPGTTYQYQWTAEESGSYFYHAHYKGQMGDGLFGAILIAPADDAKTPWSLIDSSAVSVLKKASEKVEPVFVGDWNRRTFSEFFAVEQAANIDWACSDSIVINGFGSQYCPSAQFIAASASPLAALVLNGTALTAKGCFPPNSPITQGGQYLPFQNLAALPDDAYNTCIGYTGSNYTTVVDATEGYKAFTFINSAAIPLVNIAIDSHKLWIYEYNGNYIVPQQVDQTVVANGERISFFIKLDQPAGDYTLRVANAGLNQVFSGFGVISYKGGKDVSLGVASLNYGNQNLTEVVTFNPFLASPYPPSVPATSADRSFLLDIVKSPAQPTEAWAWTLSGVESYNQTNDDGAVPLLFQDVSKIPASDLILETYSNEWVDLIIKISGPIAEPHPIHKHANKFYMIGAGVGDFNFTNVADAVTAGYPFNFQTPPYVDGFTSLPANGNNTWMVFRYQVNTPGAWLLHCHIQNHFSGGMAVAILDGVDNFPVSPPDVGHICVGTGVSNYPGLGSTSSSGGGSGTSTNNEGVSTTSSSSVSTFTGAASSVTVSMASLALGLFALAFAL